MWSQFPFSSERRILRAVYDFANSCQRSDFSLTHLAIGVGLMFGSYLRHMSGARLSRSTKEQTGDEDTGTESDLNGSKTKES